METVPRLIAEVLAELRARRAEEMGLARPLSRSKLSRMTVRVGYEGVAEKTIEAIESNPGRVPDADIIEALAQALEVDPESFYEYPIAVARREAREAKAPAEAADGTAIRVPPLPESLRPQRRGRQAS